MQVKRFRDRPEGDVHSIEDLAWFKPGQVVHSGSPWWPRISYWQRARLVQLTWDTLRPQALCRVTLTQAGLDRIAEGAGQDAAA